MHGNGCHIISPLAAKKSGATTDHVMSDSPYNGAQLLTGRVTERLDCIMKLFKFYAIHNCNALLCIVFRWGCLLEYVGLPYICSTYLLVGKEDVGSDWFAPLRSDADTQPLALPAAAAETEDTIEDDGATTSAAIDEPRPPSPATCPPSPAPVNNEDVDEDLIATVRAIAECTID